MANPTPLTCPAKRDAVDHIAIPVTDIRGTVAWYRERFECDILYEDATWAMLQFANIKLALVIPEQHPAHIAFTHSDAAKFGPLKTHRDGTRSCYARDPAGNAVEILAVDATTDPASVER